MSEHKVTIDWTRDTPDFAYQSYTRNHLWRFDHGTIVEASAAPSYRGDPNRVDPEEALVAAISSCHMLTFLAIAARDGVTIDRYVDDAVGYMEKNEDRKLAVTRVELRPRITFVGPESPDEATLARMHDLAHHACFIANSVKTKIEIL